MSWDYNFNNQAQYIHSPIIGPFKNNIELNSQLPTSSATPVSALGSVSSMSSTESVYSSKDLPNDYASHNNNENRGPNNTMGTHFPDFVTEGEMEAKLLPPNLWGERERERERRAAGKNTIEETLFLQNQLKNGDSLWYSSSSDNSSNLNHSASQQSIFDMKYNHQLNALNTQILPNYTASTTPASSTTPPIPQFNPLNLTSFNQLQTNTLINNSTYNNTMDHMNPGSVTSGSNGSSHQATPQLSNNTQNNMLQNYQQQQALLEALQQQQQQQQLLQNPLFLQQQAQLVSQQLQQLQLQLQLQQQQIETTAQLLNAKQLGAIDNSSSSNNNNLPSLTQENLTKLQAPNGSNTEKPAQGSGSSSGGSDPNKSNVNTELYKTELCSTFGKTGACPYGTKCQFAHGKEELKVVDRGTKWRSKPCANWSKTGSCRYGNRCCFRHGE